MQSLRSCMHALLFVVLVAALGREAAGAPPLSSLVPFERIDADPQKAYALTEQNGPWLIMVTTLQGPKAAENGQALAYELRKSYKLNAYTHRMTIDNSAALAGRGLDRSGRSPRMRNRQGDKSAEIAVLVGDFNGVDDPRIEETLARIKKLRPQTLSKINAQEDSFDSLRDSVLPASQQRKNVGPLRLAFATTNPMLPETFYHPKGVDQHIVDMNRGVEFGLLDCQGRYTLRVATFSGTTVIDPKQMDEIAEATRSMKSRLIDAAEKAHSLTVFLRAKGYEAYEFHDRHSSIVTVGGYESPGRLDESGRIIYSPEVQEKIDRFGAKSKRNRDGTLGPFLPQRIESLKIFLDSQPMVIEVPRRSYGSDYARAMTK